MPAPYTKKHFLEMSPREYEAWKEEQRQQELQRPGRDAIENVYPEAFIVPGAVAAIKRLKEINAVRQANTQRAIKNLRIPPEHKANPWANVRTENSNAPLKNLRDKEALIAQQQARRALDTAINKSNVKAVAENLDKFVPSDSSEEYKRGGKVKAHRGDGIAQRGKTKGRMI